VTGGDPRQVREGAIPGAGVLGMWIFLATLTVLFLASIVGYLVVRLKATDWPPPGMPRLPAGLWLATLVLIAGSVTIHLALRAIRSDERAASTRWLGMTTTLALTFLAIQSWNWWGLIRLHMTAASNLYAFTFFMLTGLHAAHVIGGVALLAIVLSRSLRGRYGSSYYGGVTYAAMYWHFLDAIWLVLFAVMVVFA
jgi:heme/copper-type cytochrome/quinol oxidase subunit 3